MAADPSPVALPDLTERQARAKLAAASRWHPDSPDLTAAREAQQRAALEEHVRRLVDAAPPLTAEQRNRLAVLLLAGGTAA